MYFLKSNSLVNASSTLKIQQQHIIKRYRVLLLAVLILIAFIGYAVAHIAKANAVVPPTTLGVHSYQKYETKSLSSSAKLQINVANGNLILETNEFGIKSVGPAMNVTRYFNDRATGSGSNGSHGTFGMGRMSQLLRMPMAPQHTKAQPVSKSRIHLTAQAGTTCHHPTRLQSLRYKVVAVGS